MPVFLISLLRGKSLRYVIIGLLCFSVAVGGYVVFNKIWTAGYDTAQVEYQKQLLAETQKAVAEAKIQWARSAKVAAAILEKERQTNEDVNNVIDKIPAAVINSGCDRVGPDVLRLFNEAINPDRNAADPGSANP